MNPSSPDPLNKIYLGEIEEAIEHLVLLKKDGFLSIPHLHWWLRTYKELYQYCKANWKNGSCFGELPDSYNLKGELSRFNDLYSALEKITDLYKYEKILKEEIRMLPTVLNDHPALIEWLKKNEKLGTDDFLMFWTEWLEEDNTLKPFILGWRKLNLKFKAEEWKHTINFLEEFNELYWDSDVCKSL